MNTVNKLSIQLRKKRWFRHILTCCAIVVSGFLQAIAVQVFIRPSNLMSAGFMGISILIHRIGLLVGIDIPLAAVLIVLNIPVACICFKGISSRFTYYSLAQVLCSSIFISIVDFDPFFNDIILNVIFGGVINGLAISIALKGNASTGGTDFIALFISNKCGKTIWQYVFIGNTLLLILFGYLFGWENAGYSIIFQYISTKLISTFHQRYQLVTLQITTLYPTKVMEAYFQNIRHGISCVEVIGGYSQKKMYLLHTVISSYEVLDAIFVLQEADSSIIINQIETVNFYGNFYREPE